MSDDQRFPDPELLRETTVRLGEHEVLLSFNGDEDAYRFHDWWHKEGAESLAAYGWEGY